MIYLDNNASTHVLPQIYEQIYNRRLDFLGNSDSQHAAGRAVRDIIDGSRSKVAALLGVSQRQVVFTSGATEANSIALSSYKQSGYIILAPQTEHASVLKHATCTIPVLQSGLLNQDELIAVLKNFSSTNKIVLACMFANNETGVISDPTGDILNICKEFGAELHIDASQCFAKGGTVTEAQVKYASTIVLSGHKMHSLKGVGALIFKDETYPILKPIALGGPQEWNIRPGTLNAEAIYSFGLAADDARENRSIKEADMRLKILEIENQLSDISLVNGDRSNRLCNTTNLYFKNITDLHLFIEDLSKEGVMVSGLSACDSGMTIESHVLRAMYGDNSDRLRGSIRISISKATTWQEIHNAIQIIRNVYTIRSACMVN